MNGPIPALRGTDGWREVPIEARDEPLVRVADIGAPIHDDPKYHQWGIAGAFRENWLRDGVAHRLRRAAESLPDGYSLVVWDGYRSIETQKALFDQYCNELIALHPDWPVEMIEVAASKYVTPPSLSPDAPPPHLTGGAVDLTLGDAHGAPLDLGTSFDAFIPAAGAAALEDQPGHARELRRLLFWTMHEQGFTAYVEEWWHFDVGDQFWGLVAARPAHYAGADAP